MKIILAAAALFLSASVLAEEWALINSSGTVIQVVVASSSTVIDLPRMGWLKTPAKVGVGWTFDGVKFSSPVFQVASSTDTGGMIFADWLREQNRINGK